MPLADRRVATRFEIVGELWGSLQTLQSLRICNLAPEGALVESVAPLVPAVGGAEGCCPSVCR